MIIYGISLSFLSKFELAVFCLVVMIISSVGLYDGRMAKIKSELVVIFNASSVLKLEMMEHYANTGQWPDSEWESHDYLSINSPTIEKYDTNSDGSFQFIISSPYAEINQKIIRFEPLSGINPMSLAPLKWQCRLYHQPTSPKIKNLQKITEGDFIPYLCRD